MAAGLRQWESMTPANAPSATKWVLPSVALLLAVTTVLGWVTLAAERTRSEELAIKNAALMGSLEKVRVQLDSVSGRLSSLDEAVKTLQAPAPAAAPVAEPRTVSIRRAPKPSSLRRISPAASAPPRDPRVDQLQTRLSGQEKELASTREQLARSTQDLEGRLSSTRDELSGSIARTREELVELQRRGERNYHEFDLFKNKEFSRAGPLGLSLRKADVKRRSYQLKLRVDDQEMEKKNVNLFEPILISTPEHGQPLQLVVMEITKDRVKGYISEPKVRQPALARTSTSAPALQTRP
jgi:hypothetical protein